MTRRLGLTLVWLGFLMYAFVLAPPQDPDTLALIQHLATGEWRGINPAIVALFNLMGVWPLAYGSLALIDGHGQKIPAWPFVVGSMGLGAFLLLPYLILRTPGTAAIAGQSYPQPQSRLRRWLLGWVESRWWGAGIFLGGLVLVGYGLGAGDWGDFLHQWQTSRFIHVMTLDFCLLWLLVPTLLGEDMARRGLYKPGVLALITALPLVGIGAYLILRPPLTPTPAPAAP